MIRFFLSNHLKTFTVELDMRILLHVIPCLLLFVSPFVLGQNTITAYYDKDWKSAPSKDLADYYRVYNTGGGRKMFRDYYITGELKRQGDYLSIDVNDDNNSVFDGEVISYYKSGKTEYVDHYSGGELNGESTSFDEKGLVKAHGYYKDGQFDGLLTNFDENHNCYQREYSNGELVHDYVTVSSPNGQVSRLSPDLKKVITRSPSEDDKQIESFGGQRWQTYYANGLTVAFSNNTTRDYGKYYRIDVIVMNNSLFPIAFDMGNINMYITDTKGEKSEMAILTANDYLQKVDRRQAWAKALNNIVEGIAADQAAYSASGTSSSTAAVAGYGETGAGAVAGTNGLAVGGYNKAAVAAGVSATSLSTVSYNGFAAYQANMIAQQREMEYNNQLLDIRNYKENNYLKSVTVNPGESISGFYMVSYEKGVLIEADLSVDDATYHYQWKTDLAEKVANKGFKNDLSHLKKVASVSFVLNIEPAVRENLRGHGNEDEVAYYENIFIESFNKAPHSKFKLTKSAEANTLIVNLSRVDVKDAEVHGYAYFYDTESEHNYARLPISGRGSSSGKTFNLKFEKSIKMAARSLAYQIYEKRY